MSASKEQLMVQGEFAHQAGCRRKCSRIQRRAQTKCRHRKISKTETAPGVAARSSAGLPRPVSGPPPLPPGEPQSWGWGTEGRPEGRTAATLLDQTQRSLSRVKKRKRQDVSYYCKLYCTSYSPNSKTVGVVCKMKIKTEHNHF